ncbi:formate hydrogenlyase maturation HycH family protein, partial [Klebsiella pneumoniae]|uniref:formate hydrogenlyase maturation HycH family protein n=1 Tax=Klebsiella pneumoniae TaxID=573 RepID=UPI0039692A62
FQGLLTFGEINIYSEHTHMLALAFDPIAKSDDPLFSEWSQTLINLLGEIVIEPAIYLIVKRKP